MLTFTTFRVTDEQFQNEANFVCQPKYILTSFYTLTMPQDTLHEIKTMSEPNNMHCAARIWCRQVCTLGCL